MNTYASSSFQGTLIIWRRRLERLLPRWEWTPHRIAVTYAFLAFGGLYVSDVLFVEVITNQALLHQLQALKGGLEIVLTAGVIFVLTTSSRRSLEQHATKLARSQEELQVLHRVLRHNLRNDVNIILGNAELVQKAADSDDITEYCATIESQSREITQYVSQAERIHTLTENGSPSVIDIVPRINQLAAEYDDQDTVSVDVETPDSACVEALDAIDSAVDELVTNAITHNDTSHQEVMISVTPDPERSDLLRIQVADNGPGLPEHERTTIQQRGETDLVHSDGMGLWIAHWTVTLSGGELGIDDRDPRGSVVTLWLPRI